MYTGSCQFDCTEETEGAREHCPRSGEPIQHLNPDGFAPVLCDQHTAYVEGYLAGHWDGAGRPGYDSRDDREYNGEKVLRGLLNLHDCMVIDCGAKDQRSVDSFTSKGPDPSHVRLLECGHAYF